MIDFKNAKSIYIYPGYTDMRYGLNGFYLLTSQPEENTVHIFCGKKNNQNNTPFEGSIYLISKRLTAGRYNWPEKGEITQLQVEEILKELKKKIKKILV